MALRWETLESFSGRSLLRLEVPGGWLVKFEIQVERDAPAIATTSSSGYSTVGGTGVAGVGAGGGLTFVPDEKHEWQPE